MNWVILITTVISLIVLTRGDDSCECDSDDSCDCDVSKAYAVRLGVITAAVMVMVGIVAAIILCCLYNRSMKGKRIQTVPEKGITSHNAVQRTVPNVLIWTTTTTNPPPPQYTGTDLQNYQQGSRDGTDSPPPPYMK